MNNKRWIGTAAHQCKSPLSLGMAGTYKKTRKVEYDQFFSRPSRLLMDEADFDLAKHHGLSDDELDVVLNHDFKFRTSPLAAADD